jgi:hypothetical protein
MRRNATVTSGMLGIEPGWRPRLPVLLQASVDAGSQAAGSRPSGPSASSTGSASQLGATITHKQVVQLFGTVPPLEARAGAEPPAALSAEVAGTLRKARTTIVRSPAAQHAAEQAGGDEELGGQQRQQGQQGQQQLQGPAARWQDEAMDVALGGGVVVLSQRQALDLISAICGAKVGGGLSWGAVRGCRHSAAWPSCAGSQHKQECLRLVSPSTHCPPPRPQVAADMAALAQQQPLHPMDQYVPQYFRHQAAAAASGAAVPAQQQQQQQQERRVALALAQLVASIMAHAPHSAQVAEFGVLAGCIPEGLSQMASACSGRTGAPGSETSQQSQLPQAEASQQPQQEQEQQQQQEEERAGEDEPAGADGSVKLHQPLRGDSALCAQDASSSGQARPCSAGSEQQQLQPPAAGSSSSTSGGWGSRLRKAASNASDRGLGPPRPKLQPELLLPGQMMHPLVATVLRELPQLPGGAALLDAVASGALARRLGEGDLGLPLTEEHAPLAHLLLLEAADVLRVHPLPALYLRQDGLPFVHLLHLPAAWKGRPGSGEGGGGGGSRGGRRRQGRQPGGSSSSSHGGGSDSGTAGAGQQRQGGWRRKAALVLSSALLERVQQDPQQLQLVLAAAMAPLCTWGGMGWDPSGAQPPALSSAGPGAALADVLTAAALMQLAPGVLLEALPPQAVAMLPGLAPSLQVAARMALLVGDRAVQLVAQSEQQQHKMQLQLHTMAAATGIFASLPSGGGGDAPAGLQAWLERALAEGGGSAAALDDLMSRLAQEVTAGVYEGGGGGGGGADAAGAMSLARLRALEARRWLLSLDGYPAIMATARPLRRVMPPALQRQ